ncbi:MAG: hypothetical protein IJ721_10340 [Bacteroidales bacterium]|nr:hypothetical protein [Bacteroidales bacterium]
MEHPDFTPERISELKAEEVFVFGSNLADMHGGGAAYAALKQFGAVPSCGIAGFQDREIAPLFAEAVDVQNVCLPETFVKELE